jgi:membrane protein DedA with SNARE-associated domain
VYGTRNLSMLFWGAQGLPWLRFLLVDVPTCLAWATLLVALGRTASGGASGILGEVERGERWLLGAVVVAAAVVAAWRALVRRRLR